MPILHTYDDKILKQSGKIGTQPLPIEKPSWSDNLPLFDTIQVADNTDVQAEIIVSESEQVPALPENEDKGNLLLPDGNGKTIMPPVAADNSVSESIHVPAEEESIKAEESKQE